MLTWPKGKKRVTSKQPQEEEEEDACPALSEIVESMDSGPLDPKIEAVEELGGTAWYLGNCKSAKKDFLHNQRKNT